MAPGKTFDTEGTEINNPRHDDHQEDLSHKLSRSQRRKFERQKAKRLKKGRMLIHRLKKAAKNNDQKEVEAVKERLKELRKQ